MTTDQAIVFAILAIVMALLMAVLIGLVYSWVVLKVGAPAIIASLAGIASVS